MLLNVAAWPWSMAHDVMHSHRNHCHNNWKKTKWTKTLRKRQNKWQTKKIHANEKERNWANEQMSKWKINAQCTMHIAHNFIIAKIHLQFTLIIWRQQQHKQLLYYNQWQPTIFKLQIRKTEQNKTKQTKKNISIILNKIKITSWYQFGNKF